MNNFKSVFKSVIKEMFNICKFVLSNSIYPISKILTLSLPYIMLFLGVRLYKQRGYFSIGGEILIPIMIYLIAWFLKSFSNKLGKGENPPIPNERFTSEEDGEVSCEYSRLQELLLFVNDYENWLERKGMM